MPQVSIVMTTYNRVKYLPQAIDSVLAQNFDGWELIIVDDGSTDGTSEIVEKYAASNKKIRHVKNITNLGIVKSRNLALSICEGKYVAVLDSDDVWTGNDKLKKQTEFLQVNADYVLLGGMANVIDETGNTAGVIRFKKNDRKIRQKMLLSNQFVHSSVMFRKDTAQSVGGYGNFGVGEDYDLFLKMGLKGKIANLPDILVNYRRHPSGATWENRVFSAKEHLKIIKKYKGIYPNFYQAILKANLRIVLALLKII
jgi:glycosyltransferase involved in cell wall biosynthesis